MFSLVLQKLDGFGEKREGLMLQPWIRELYGLQKTKAQGEGRRKERELGQDVWSRYSASGGLYLNDGSFLFELVRICAFSPKRISREGRIKTALRTVTKTERTDTRAMEASKVSCIKKSPLKESATITPLQRIARPVVERAVWIAFLKSDFLLLKLVILPFFYSL